MLLLLLALAVATCVESSILVVTMAHPVLSERRSNPDPGVCCPALSLLLEASKIEPGGMSLDRPVLSGIQGINPGRCW